MKQFIFCHPTEHNSLFPKEVRANMAHLSGKTVHQIALERTEEVKRWVALSKELSTKERDLKSSISPRNAEVLKDKKLCLLERLLEEAGHEDTGLVEDIKRGFDLTGALPRSGVFNQKFRPASMTCVLLESVQSLRDKEIDLSLFHSHPEGSGKRFHQGAHKQRRAPCRINSHKAVSREAEEQGETH